MGTKTITVRTDDLTGEAAEDLKTILVNGADGTAYWVEMGRDSRAAYAAAVEPFCRVGTPVVESSTTPVTAAVSAPREEPGKALDNQALRAWWRENPNGLPPLAERGRVPREVKEAYMREGYSAPAERAPGDVPKPRTGGRKAKVKAAAPTPPRKAIVAATSKTRPARKPARVSA